MSERYVSFVLLECGPHRESCHWFGAVQTTLVDEAFSLMRICFVFNAPLVPTDDAVEGASLCGIVGTWSKAVGDGELVLLSQCLFEPH